MAFQNFEEETLRLLSTLTSLPNIWSYLNRKAEGPERSSNTSSAVHQRRGISETLLPTVSSFSFPDRTTVPEAVPIPVFSPTLLASAASTSSESRAKDSRDEVQPVEHRIRETASEKKTASAKSSNRRATPQPGGHESSPAKRASYLLNEVLSPKELMANVAEKMKRPNSPRTSLLQAKTEEPSSSGSPVESDCRLYQPVPTCAICNADSTGIHFGVEACAACSAFFRRTIVLDKKYICPKTGQCAVRKESVGSQRCRACRFKKCVGVGMDRTAVQHRRDAIGKFSTVRPEGSPKAKETPDRVTDITFSLQKQSKKRTVMEEFLARRIEPRICLEYTAELEFIQPLTPEEKAILFKNFYLKFQAIEEPWLTWHYGGGLERDWWVMPNRIFMDFDRVNHYFDTDVMKDLNLDKISSLKLFLPSFKSAMRYVGVDMDEIQMTYEEMVVLSGLVFLDTSISELSEETRNILKEVRDQLLRDLFASYVADEKIEEPEIRLYYIIITIASVNKHSLKTKENMNMLKLFDIIPRDDLFEEICNLRVDQEVDEEKFDPEVRPFITARKIAKRNPEPPPSPKEPPFDVQAYIDQLRQEQELRDARVAQSAVIEQLLQSNEDALRTHLRMQSNALNQLAGGIQLLPNGDLPVPSPNSMQWSSPLMGSRLDGCSSILGPSRSDPSFAVPLPPPPTGMHNVPLQQPSMNLHGQQLNVFQAPTGVVLDQSWLIQAMSENIGMPPQQP